MTISPVQSLAERRQSELEALLPKLKQLSHRADDCPGASRALSGRLRWGEPWTLLHTYDFALAWKNMARKHGNESVSAQAYSEACGLLSAFLRPVDKSYIRSFHTLVNGLEMRGRSPRSEEEPFFAAFSQAVMQADGRAYRALLKAAEACVYSPSVVAITAEQREGLQATYQALEVQAMLRGYLQ